MDTGLLSQMLSKLLKSHDEVTLPGLGVLVTELMPATFSDKGYTINPPYRKLSFRQREMEGSALLVEAYAEVNGVAIEESEHIVNAFLSELKDRLKEEKLIELPGLGRLRATRENHFFFVMDEEADIFPDGFGLERIHIKALSTAFESEEETVPALIPDAEPKPEPEPEPKQTLETVSVAPKVSAVETSRKHLSPFWVVMIVILGIAVFAFLALAVLGRVAPDLVDSILYTAEELEILNS